MLDLVKTIKKVSKRHPGYIGEFLPTRLLKYYFLKKGLDREVKAGMVNVQSHPEFPNLKIYKYSQDAVMERHWNEITLISRGLILDTDAKRVLATPFLKFFNYGELVPISELMEKDFIATEKMDGSLGILFYYKGWRIATGGSFASEQAQWANEYFKRNIREIHLDVGDTYLLEIIYPENRIVVPYSKDALYLLSAYSRGYEYDLSYLFSTAFCAGFMSPKIYCDFKELDKILHEASMIDHTREGFVVRFASGVRVKIKGDEYCRIHKLISRVTPIAVWEMLLNGDDMDRVLDDLPEEMETDYKKIVSILEKNLKDMLDGLEFAYEMTKHLSDKELGLELSNKESKLVQDKNFARFKGYVFARRKESFLEQFENVDSMVRKSIFKQFRPKSNFLVGYTPSSAMNRFNDG